MTANSTSSVVAIDVSSLIEHGPITPLQWETYALCFACVMIDGFDLQSLSFAAPSLIRDWGIPSARMGPVFSAALVGVLIGSIFFSMLADKVGRRPVLIATTLWFAIATYLTGQATALRELTLLRFLAGLGMGGIMPNAMALAGEYAPTRKRILTMMLVSTGFTVGALTAGLVAEWLIPYAGWRAMFTFGGCAALLVGAVMALRLPESLPLLALRGKLGKSTRKWLRRLVPEIGNQAEFTLTARRGEPGLPLRHLFREKRAITTLLLWVANFLNLLNLYFLTNWLPTAVREFGFSNSTAIRSGTLVQLGGLAGGLALGLFAERLGIIRVLTACFLLGCGSLGMISRAGLPVAALFVVACLAGVAISGGQVALNALAAICYPTSLRATGIGASLGVGRFGAILGPAIAGALLAQHWQPHSLFLAAAFPALLSAFVVFSLRWHVREQ